MIPQHELRGNVSKPQLAFNHPRLPMNPWPLENPNLMTPESPRHDNASQTNAQMQTQHTLEFPHKPPWTQPNPTHAITRKNHEWVNSIVCHATTKKKQSWAPPRIISTTPWKRGVASVTRHEITTEIKRENHSQPMTWLTGRTRAPLDHELPRSWRGSFWSLVGPWPAPLLPPGGEAPLSTPPSFLNSFWYVQVMRVCNGGTPSTVCTVFSDLRRILMAPEEGDGGWRWRKKKRARRRSFKGD